MAMKSVIQLQREEGRATLLFSRNDKSVNVLDEACLEALEGHLNTLEANVPEILILQSALQGCFIAGADIHAIAAIDDAEKGAELAKRGQRLCQRIEQLASVSVAVVQGVCLGGGLELAMACDYIIVVKDDKTSLALPEIKIGIHPGFGGCVRLPQRVGWTVATPMILSGRAVNAKRAKRIGLADMLCHTEQIEAACVMLGKQGKRHTKHVKPWWFSLPPARTMFFKLAERKVRGKFCDVDNSYPALITTLKTLHAIAGLSGQSAYTCEAESIGRLAITPVCKHLIRVFFLGEALKHQEAVKLGKSAAAKLQHTAVYGAGIMGSGIAWVAAKDGTVDLHDVSAEALSRGLKAASKFSRRPQGKNQQAVHQQAVERLQRIRPSLDCSGLASADTVIEAILEDLNIKKKLWADSEALVDSKTLLLSNTSSLSLSEQQADLKHPERMAGMHFFNPAPKMPLVEIIAGDKTSAETIHTVAALAVRWGKFPVVVADRPGFLVNRCLMPFMTAALRLLQQGQSAPHIDGVLKRFGMPMGAIELADRVGLDICLHVGEHLSSSFDGPENGASETSISAQPTLKQFAMPEWFAKMVADGLLGEKSGSGFYVYDKGKRQAVNKNLDNYVQAASGLAHPHREKEFDADIDMTGETGALSAMSAEEIIEACLIPMLVEALRCLDQGVLDHAKYLDAALVYGIGFPPFRGGLLCYFAGKNRSELRQTMVDLGFEIPVNLEVLDEFS
ncbi:MAG: 3-hydroxyacyl-CoA dehydrogenase NAD-binding domain-containing protein [Mariprofundaceae bacterium]|nr:3-hydroxyacyl-CoA dehydrogenase NAD-binding domain-containing protein [Mariprofundaceae bacterium]